MIEVKPYTLPDYNIFGSTKQFEALVWQPETSCLVLGQSNNAESSLFTDSVIGDGIPVYKRPSGGETVILTPQMLVIAVLLAETKLQNPKIYFEKINKAIIDALSTLGFENMSQKGISDICLGPKKILGSSIYRKSGKVFYHAVLNVAEDIGTIAKYIKHPQKEPEYRMGRKHEDFVTSLVNASSNIDMTKLKETLARYLLNIEEK